MNNLLAITSANFVHHVSWRDKYSNLSVFDNKLLSAWNDAMQKGYFRYKLNIQESSVLPGKLNIFAELNTERGEQRRKPQEFTSVNDPFNSSLFNFTRIGHQEVLFKLALHDSSHQSDDHDILAINVSPMNEGHSLLLPQVNKMQPQILSEYSIELGLSLLMMSSTPSFRVVFNSLCGFASVNHLHLHCVYINNPMALESITLKTLQGPCFELVDFPSKGFAFQCQPKNKEDVKILARNVFKLTNFLHHQNQAHNVVITRSNQTKDEEFLSSVRVYVWVRKPVTGSKQVSAFNPAALELFGYIMYTNESRYKNKNEEDVAKILEETTSSFFHKYRDLVIKLFQS